MHWRVCSVLQWRELGSFRANTGEAAVRGMLPKSFAHVSDKVSRIQVHDQKLVSSGPCGSVRIHEMLLWRDGKECKPFCTMAINHHHNSTTKSSATVSSSPCSGSSTTTSIMLLATEMHSRASLLFFMHAAHTQWRPQLLQRNQNTSTGTHIQIWMSEVR